MENSTENVAQPVTVPEVGREAEDFFAHRAAWFEIRAFDKPGGGFDVWLRVDGSYAPDRELKENLVRLWKRDIFGIAHRILEARRPRWV